MTFEEGLEKDERVSVKVGGWRESSSKCKVLMLEPGWKMDYLQKTQVLKQSQVGWMGGERDGGRPREERRRRSDGNGQREKAELCMKILYAIVRSWTFL